MKIPTLGYRPIKIKGLGCNKFIDFLKYPATLLHKAS